MNFAAKFSLFYHLRVNLINICGSIFYSLWFWYEEPDKHPSAVVLCPCYTSTSDKLFLFLILMFSGVSVAILKRSIEAQLLFITLFGNVKGKTQIKLTPCNYPSSSQLFIMQLYYFWEARVNICEYICFNWSSMFLLSMIIHVWKTWAAFRMQYCTKLSCILFYIFCIETYLH